MLDILAPPEAQQKPESPAGADNLPPAAPEWDSGPETGRQTWGQDYDDAGKVVERSWGDEPEAEGQAEEPEQKATPAAAAPAPAAHAPLEDRIRQLEAQLAESRGRDSYAQQVRSEEERRRAQQEYEALQQPPEFDVEEAMSDPKQFRQALLETAEWSRRRTLAEVAPHLQVVQHLQQQQGPMQNLAMRAAWQEADRQLKAEGIQDAERHVQDVMQLIANSRDGWAHALDPASLAEGVRFVRRHKGEPDPVRVATKSTPDTPGGSGSPARAAAKPKKTAALAHVEREMGVKFTDGDLREFAERQQGRA